VDLPRTLQITAASRLHFGLLSFGNPQVPQYGGVGVMVDRPDLRVVIEPADRFSVQGPLSGRAGQFAQRWQQQSPRAELPSCRLRILSAPSPHVGLGVGTQLALSVALLLDRFTTGEARPIEQLAQAVGRGRRSSIGTHGFAQGGLLCELGKQSGQPLATLADRVELPRAWRVVQIRPRGEAGLWGEAENDAFRQLPPVPTQVTEQLLDEIHHRMLPAARSGNLEGFGESVYQYGVRAGMCFASQQGGPFANELLEGWSATIRRRGIQGVGQSSWGPTLFVFLADEDSARDFIRWFGCDVLTPSSAATLLSSRIANRGAQLVAPEPAG
jgi:beta-RFAP synthase